LDELQGATAYGLDGEVGKVKDFYFDDEKWAIRYVLVDAEEVRGRTDVLLSPISLSTFETQKGRFKVNLLKEQIRNSPEIETELPLSRQEEVLLNDYFGWTDYWEGNRLWGTAEDPASLGILTWEKRPMGKQKPIQEADKSHLRSVNETQGFEVEASDGMIGHVAGFMVEQINWLIRYMVVALANGRSARNVLIHIGWMREVNWEESRAIVDLKKDSVENSPELKTAGELAREYEERLHDHYGKCKYWEKGW
jgi:hypothetical protein